MEHSQNKWLRWITALQGIAQTGLTYCKDVYDRERYEQLRQLTCEMTAEYVDLDMSTIQKFFSADIGYATPKIDLRAFILHENKVLLVQESSDGKWSLPGGWADVNYSPKENIIKEINEETGCDATIERLIALWDTAKHDNRQHWPHLYKGIFHCSLLSYDFKPCHEILAVQFFELTALPELSTERITAKQIALLFDIVKNDLPLMCD